MYYTTGLKVKPQFIFICASSGTGKTQLAFSLNIPLLYFNFNSDILKKRDYMDNKTQTIYKNYWHISEILMRCVKQDIILQGLDRDNNEINEYMNLFLPSLIYMLCMNILEKKKNKKYEEESWLVTELRINGEIHKMSIVEATKKIKDIFKDKQMPVIIFDECQRDSSDNQFLLSYLYVRRCIKSMGLISIFMGTNANLSNYVNSSKAIGSREGDIGENIDVPWCFLVYKLSPTSKEYINMMNKKVNKVAGKCVKKESRDSINKMIKFVTGSLKKERPLFAKLIYENIITNIENGVIKPIEIIEKTIESIVNIFMSRKKFLMDFREEKTVLNYNFSNLSLISPELNEEENKVKRIKNRQIDKASGVHNHIAYLYVPENIKKIGKNYFGLSIGDTSDLYFSGIRDENNKEINFRGEQEFLCFSEEPFSQMGFLRKDNNRRIFLKYTGDKKVNRISTYNMMNLLFNENAINRIKKIDEASHWMLFEISVSIAALIATHYNGFEGTKFDEWFTHFLKELNSEYPETIEIEWLDELSIIRDIKIPLCAPSLSADWNTELKDYLIEECNANVGILGKVKLKKVEIFILKNLIKMVENIYYRANVKQDHSI